MSMKSAKLMTALALGVCLTSGAVWAEGNLNGTVHESHKRDTNEALEMTGNGVKTTGEGLVTLVATPIVVTHDLAHGNLDDAGLNLVRMPVSGTVNTATGAVQAISGIGMGITSLMTSGLRATGKVAEAMTIPDSNPLP